MPIQVCNHCSKVYKSSRRIRSFCSTACTHANQRQQFVENFDTLFWGRVDQSGGPDACWPWTAKINKRRGGYGVANLPGRKERRAHRVAYELAAGMLEPLSSDQKLLHSCDNPPCCNPRHLSIGTTQANSADMANKGRSTRGERSWHAILTEASVKEIRARRRQGGVTRRQLADEFGVSESTIQYVVTGGTWKHVS